MTREHILFMFSFALWAPRFENVKRSEAWRAESTAAKVATRLAWSFHRRDVFKFGPPRSKGRIGWKRLRFANSQCKVFAPLGIARAKQAPSQGGAQGGHKRVRKGVRKGSDFPVSCCNCMIYRAPCGREIEFSVWAAVGFARMQSRGEASGGRHGPAGAI